MKAWMLAAVAGVAIGTAAVPKDRAAIMYYTGRDSVLSFVPSPDSANFAVVMLNIWRDSVPVTQLGGRPCVGIALFSRSEMAQSVKEGKRPEDLRPQDAAVRIKVYGATGTRPLVVHNLAEGRTFEALVFDEELQRGATGDALVRLKTLKGTIEHFLAGRNGKCTAE